MVRCDFSVAPTVYGDIEQSVEIDAPPDRVFEALIIPQQLERWIASRARVEPRVGGVYDIGWELSGTVKILELEPGARLVYSWAAYQDEPETVVTWTLEGSGGKTRLTIVQSGFDPDIPLDGLYTGWLHYLQRIKSLVEYGDDWQPAINKSAPRPIPTTPRRSSPGSKSCWKCELARCRRRAEKSRCSQGNRGSFVGQFPTKLPQLFPNCINPNCNVFWI